jgi:O-succinylbenzoic acid--CoA ligase
LWPVSGDAEGILALLRTWDASEDPRPLVIETSGSTGHPKRVMLSRNALRASALATQERLGGPGQWVLNLPPTYVAGVQVLYRSVVAGTEPVVLEPYSDEVPELRAERRYISLVSTQLVRALIENDQAVTIDQLRSFDAVLIGGGPLDPRVRSQAESRGISIVQTYGMSETCGGCVYDGVPLDGVEIRIDPEGHVLLRGPMLFDGYEGQPDRTHEAFRDGWLVTNDLGHWDPRGRLKVDGRIDDVIISGGVKVPAAAVAAMITADSAVLEAVVVGVPDREWGERVVAVVEPFDPLTLDGLRDLVEPRSWAPRQLVLVESLPRLFNGKPDRAAIKRLAADA